MKFLIVKVKDKDLYFNADEIEGPYVCGWYTNLKDFDTWKEWKNKKK